MPTLPAIQLGIFIDLLSNYDHERSRLLPEAASIAHLRELLQKLMSNPYLLVDRKVYVPRAQELLPILLYVRTIKVTKWDTDAYKNFFRDLNDRLKKHLQAIEELHSMDIELNAELLHALSTGRFTQFPNPLELLTTNEERQKFTAFKERLMPAQITRHTLPFDQRAKRETPAFLRLSSVDYQHPLSLLADLTRAHSEAMISKTLPVDLSALILGLESIKAKPINNLQKLIALINPVSPLFFFLKFQLARLQAEQILASIRGYIEQIDSALHHKLHQQLGLEESIKETQQAIATLLKDNPEHTQVTEIKANQSLLQKKEVELRLLKQKYKDSAPTRESVALEREINKLTTMINAAKQALNSESASQLLTADNQLAKQQDDLKKLSTTISLLRTYREELSKLRLTIRIGDTSIETAHTECSLNYSRDWDEHLSKIMAATIKSCEALFNKVANYLTQHGAEESSSLQKGGQGGGSDAPHVASVSGLGTGMAQGGAGAPAPADASAPAHVKPSVPTMALIQSGSFRLPAANTDGAAEAADPTPPTAPNLSQGSQ